MLEFLPPVGAGWDGTGSTRTTYRVCEGVLEEGGCETGTYFPTGSPDVHEGEFCIYILQNIFLAKVVYFEK